MLGQKTPEMNELGSYLSNACLNIKIGWVVLKLQLGKVGNKIEKSDISCAKIKEILDFVWKGWPNLEIGDHIFGVFEKLSIGFVLINSQKLQGIRYSPWKPIQPKYFPIR